MSDANTAAIVPTRRNALVVWLVPTLLFMAAPPLGNFLGTTPFRLAPSFAILAGFGITWFSVMTMTRELNQAAGSGLKFWHLFLPIYGIYWAAVMVPKAMRTAKQKANKGTPRNVALYFFLFLYAMAADLNDLAA